MVVKFLMRELRDFFSKGAYVAFAKKIGYLGFLTFLEIEA